jgi:cytochrome b subunit of formate dehydrogenase
MSETAEFGRRPSPPVSGSRPARLFFGVGILVLALVVPLCASDNKKRIPTKPSNEECLACHSDSSMTKEVAGKQVSLFVSEEHFKNSIHSMFTCVDCHTDVKTSPHENSPEKLSCAQCHADQQAAYERSLHGQALKKGDGNSATCVSCHGGPHEILPAADPKSRINHANIAATCGTCHGQKFVMEASGHSAQPFLSYQESVHGRAVAAGSDKAAVCTDCHGSHEILSASDSKSPIFKFNVPATCAKCHSSVQTQFAQSIHGQAIARGNWQAPVCTDCHGIHSIKAHLDPNSSVSAQNLAKVTCARCHEGVRLSQELGIPGARATTYLQSYHGLASKLGSQVVANCASCHGVHNILPSSDVRSTVNKANLVQTCGQCHPGVGEKFIVGKVHVDTPLSADVGSVAVRWIRRFYVGMIAFVIGGMLLHNFIIWRRKAIERRKLHSRLVTRMSKNQRWQHITLFVSFIVLVLTGFALKYPDSWFAASLGMSEKVRGVIHRTAAVFLISAGIYHLFYAFLTTDGRRLVRDLAPTAKDAGDLWGTMRYYLGFHSYKPEFGRFTYGEKAEYWALVWGLIVMAGTGIMLWAKVSFGSLLPRWWLDVATAIHFYEAVLASLAIVVWHFYQVFFDPDVYPMNWTWWDGKMSFEHYRDEHALDSETLLQAARSDAAADQVAPAAVPAKGHGGTVVEKATTTEDSPPNEEEVVSERRS